MIIIKHTPFIKINPTKRIKRILDLQALLNKKGVIHKPFITVSKALKKHTSIFFTLGLFHYLELIYYLRYLGIHFSQYLPFIMLLPIKQDTLKIYKIQFVIKESWPYIAYLTSSSSFKLLLATIHSLIKNISIFQYLEVFLHQLSFIMIYHLQETKSIAHHYKQLFNKIIYKKAYLINTSGVTSFSFLKTKTVICFIFAWGLYFLTLQLFFEDVYLSSFALLTSHIPKTKVSKSLLFFHVSKRFMWKHITHYFPNRAYATKVAFQLKKKAAEDLANDGTGKHPHVGTQQCVIADCASKKCLKPCDQPTYLLVDGHNTHKPPIGRLTRFISEEDATGDPHAQYFVKSNEKKEITKQEKQKYGKDIKPDPKAQTFIDKHRDKYD